MISQKQAKINYSTATANDIKDELETICGYIDKYSKAGFGELEWKFKGKDNISILRNWGYKVTIPWYQKLFLSERHRYYHISWK